ncbi:MAG: hypothetical protein KGI33_01140 [Thaumarchaeota archaeon]|nr:hypothetical protein [Nitrososphaerota archaeon]
MKNDLEVMKTKLNALEASSGDKQQRSMIGVVNGLVENQRRLVDEFEHLKKAIDLLTIQLFKVENKLDDKREK